MEIKDQTMTTETDADGNEFVSEIEAIYTETEADGTEVVAEITTTADADDPTEVEGHMTITEIAPDGTETVTQVLMNEEGTFIVEEESAFEEAVEEIFGVELDDNLTPIETVENVSGETETEFFQAETDFQTADFEFQAGDEMFDPNVVSMDSPDTILSEDSFEPTMETVEPTFSEMPFDDTTFAPEVNTTGTANVEDSSYENIAAEEVNQDMLEQEAHAQAATEAQQAADDFVDSGDYAAAAEAREIAENEAWEAGDDSMLSAYDAQDLSTAAERQEDAAYYEKLESEHAQSGDYEAAKEDAGNAAYAMGDADYYAGGDDHTGQADAEVYNMDNAIWHEGLADDQLENAAYQAELGNADAAEAALDSAASEQAIADDFGDRGEHGAVGADYDPSSEVETGGNYESNYDDDLAGLDTGFDTGMDTGFDASGGIDTGYDDGMDMSVDTGFDTEVDTSINTDYDSGMDDV